MSQFHDDSQTLGATPDVQDPLVPIHGYWPEADESWLSRTRRLMQEAHSISPRIVFLGNSITEGWGMDGKAEWETRFAPLGAANLGIGGDRTQQILWRIADGTLAGLTPELVVLKIGVNNLWSDVHTYSAARVAEGIQKVVAAIREECPQARVLVLGILPTQAGADHPLREIIREINTLSAAQLPTEDGSVRFADIGALFLEPNHSISPDIMPDACHLSPHGYKIFADAVEPIIHEMLNQSA